MLCDDSSSQVAKMIFFQSYWPLRPQAMPLSCLQKPGHESCLGPEEDCLKDSQQDSSRFCWLQMQSVAPGSCTQKDHARVIVA